jgi:hypothetical protein
MPTPNAGRKWRPQGGIQKYSAKNGRASSSPSPTDIIISVSDEILTMSDQIRHVRVCCDKLSGF